MGKLEKRGFQALLAVAVVMFGVFFQARDALEVTASPRAVPEWWQSLPPDQPGFPVTLSGAPPIYASSPTLADLDGNGTLEIILGSRDRVNDQPGNGGMVYAYRHNGSLLWQRHVRAPVNSTPTVSDLTGDGHPDVIVSMGGITKETQRWHGGVIALNGLTGQELWTFDTQDWLNHVHDGWLDGVISTPAVADINGDGYPEIAFGAWDQCLYLLDRHGQPLWGNLPGLLGEVYCGGHGFYNEDVFWSSPALADVTGDGRLEIITGADISPGNWWHDPAGGYLYIINADGTTLAREWMDQVIYSSPAVGDLDSDGQVEFVVGTGTFWSGKGYYVSAFDYNPNAASVRDRLVLKWRKSTVAWVFPSPALADLDGDSELDVVITVYTQNSPLADTFVYAWRGRDGSLLFQRRLCDFTGKSNHSPGSPVVADIDGDTRPEILVSHAWEVAILNHDGSQYTDYSNPNWPGVPEEEACRRDSPPTTNLTYWTRYVTAASPAVGDLDGNGQAEIVIGGTNPDNTNQGMLFAWTGHPPDPWPAWPMWHHDPQHTGNFHAETIPPTNPTDLDSPSHDPGVWSTSNQVQITWSGAKDRESGIVGYSIVWDRSPTTLPDTTTDLEAAVQSVTSPPLSDGKNNYFHLRTGDWAGNWTADALHIGPFWIDAQPPFSQASSPAVVSGPFEVTWSGSDSGSGIKNFTIQVRDGSGPWTTWLNDKATTSATYHGESGHTYYFRSIAQDQMGHVEPQYLPLGDTRTVVAEHLLSGTVHDLRGRPFADASLTAQPAALNEAVSGRDGTYILGLPATAPYDLAASHPEFLALPEMLEVTVDRDIDGVMFYLPPKPDLVNNGDFESEGGWAMAGIAPPVPVEGMGHTGLYALQLGSLPAGINDTPVATSTVEILSDTVTGANPPASSVSQAAPEATWSISQSISLPADLRKPTLAWLYRVDGTATPDDTLSVAVRGSISSITHPLSLDQTGWTHDWIDLSEFGGQEIEVRFSLVRKSTAALLNVWLDEVRLGPVPTRQIFVPVVMRSP
jgi:hypothetical protein